MTWSPKFQEFAGFLQARGDSASQALAQVLLALSPHRYQGHSFLIPVAGTLVILIVGAALSRFGPFRRATSYVSQAPMTSRMD